jgi:uncharacterized protein YdaU (DUF1376 family)
MAKLQFMPFYIGDHQADTSHLTAEQQGAYINILFAMWRSEDGWLPLKRLATISRVYRQHWKRVWEAISPMLTVEGDRVTQKRLQRERRRCLAKYEQRIAAARLGGEQSAYSRAHGVIMNATHGDCMKGVKLLTNNNPPPSERSTNHIHNHIIKEEEKTGSGSPFGSEGQGSPSPEKEGLQDSDEKVVRLPTYQPSSPACPSAEQREAGYQRLQNLKRSLNGGGR